MNKKEIDMLLKITIEIDNIITNLDKIESGFDDNDIEKIALLTLLFFSEEKILNRLADIRKILHIKLGKLIGKEELFNIFEELDEKTNKYKIRYNLTKEEMKSEILKHIILFEPIKKS